MSTLRQRLYDFKTIEELKYNALLGSMIGTDSDGFPDISYVSKFGRSGVLDTAASDDIWAYSASGDLTVLSAADTLNVVSSSIQDDASGTGLDACLISGLDNDWNPTSEFVTLDGTAAVTTTGEFRFVWRVTMLKVTATGITNAGNITLTDTTGGAVQAYVEAGISITQGSHFIVPNGYTALMTEGFVSPFRSSGTGERRLTVDLTLTPVDTALSTGIEYDTLRFGASTSAGTSVIPFNIPLQVASKTLIKGTARAEASNTRVSIEYAMILVKTVVDIDSIF